MDEVLLESDEWKELIKPPMDCLQFLKNGSVCANYWPFAQVTCQLLINVFDLALCVYLIERLAKIYPMYIDAYNVICKKEVEVMVMICFRAVDLLINFHP